MMHDLDETVAAAFPDEDIHEITALEGTGETVVARVGTGRGRFAVKSAPSTAAGTLRREVAVTNFVRRTTDVPVVEFVDVDLDPAYAPGPYYVAPWAGGPKLGTVLDSAPEPVHGLLFEQLGETLAALHAGTTYESPGDVQAIDEESIEVARGDEWPERFAHTLADQVDALAETRFDALAEEVWQYVSERLETLETGESMALVHGDVGDGNVVCEGTVVSRLLDWELAFVGHPEYDLCRAEARYFWNSWGRQDTPQARFYAGYRSVRPLAEGFDARRQCYLATFSLSPLRTFDQWGREFSDDPDDLAASLETKLRGLIS